MSHNKQAENIIREFIENKSCNGMVFYCPNLSVWCRIDALTTRNVLEKLTEEGFLEKIKQPLYKGDVDLLCSS